MDQALRKILPLLLRPYETLSSHDIANILSTYKLLGRDVIERNLACEKQTRCYVSLLLSNLGIDSDIWTEVHNEYVQRNVVILSYIEKCFDDFYNAGGRTLSLYENFGAVLSSGVSIGCFASDDVDFTVMESELDLAKRIFAENGFEAYVRKDHASVSKSLVMSFYNKLSLDGRGYWFNIMRKPVSRNFMLDQSKTLKRLHSLQSSRLERYKETNVTLLEPTAMVYFNALHFASEHYYSASPGMALCCDIDRVVRNREIDWRELKRWSIEDGCGLRIQMTLDICRFFLNTPIPVDLFINRSKYYNTLWRMLVDEDNQYLNSQNGKLSRLMVELLSDDKALFRSFIDRIL